MGNYRFRLSDMMPNAWFHKLREIGSRSRNQPISNHKTKQHQPTTASTKTKEPHHSYPRKSYHFTREFIPISPESSYKYPDPTRKSSKQRTRKRKSPKQSYQKMVMSSSVSAGCGCREKPVSPPEYSASSSSCSSSASSDCSPETEFRSDSVIATVQCFDKMVSWPNGVVETKSSTNQSDTKFDELEKFPELELPPIITKPTKLNATEEDATKTEHFKKPNSLTEASAKMTIKDETRIAIKEQKQSNSTLPVRKSIVNSSSGVRLRMNSPRLASRKIQGQARRTMSWSSRRSLSDSFAVVKSSEDPQRDFRESMVEMILENNIRGSKDLEDLLACYLSLNSDQYHDLIIKVFKQIWFDLSDVRLK